MKSFGFVALAFSLVSGATAQTTQLAANDAQDADRVWAALQAQTGGVQEVPPEPKFTEAGVTLTRGSKKTGAEVKQARADRAASYAQAAKAAKEFYTAYPKHEKAAEAKKLEAESTLMAVTEGKEQELAALKLAKQFSSDKSNSAADRFEIAVLAERVQARERTGAVFKNAHAELEKIADKLQGEFGDLPEFSQFYASVARTADRQTAARIARALLKSSSAPSSVRGEAQLILDREQFVGKTLPLSLPTLDGKVIDLSKRPGKLTVLYIWSSLTDARSLPGLASAAKTLPAGSEIVYLNVSGSGENLKRLEAETPIPGIYCFEPTSADRSVAATLKIGHVPYVFVLDRASKVSGFGPAERLPELIAAAQ